MIATLVLMGLSSVLDISGLPKRALPVKVFYMLIECRVYGRGTNLFVKGSDMASCNGSMGKPLEPAGFALTKSRPPDYGVPSSLARYNCLCPDVGWRVHPFSHIGACKVTHPLHEPHVIVVQGRKNRSETRVDSHSWNHIRETRSPKWCGLTNGWTVSRCYRKSLAPFWGPFPILSGGFWEVLYTRFHSHSIP